MRAMTLDRWFLPLSLACAVLASAIFLPGVGGAFLFDDGPNIVHNQAVHVKSLDSDSLQRAAYSFRPGGGSRALAMVTFAIDYWRAGLDPAAFKATNVAIHVLTTVALAWFFRMLLLACVWPTERASVAALALALAWAAHPLQVSSVLYVVQRMQTLATLFLTLAMLTYLKARLAQIEGRPSRPAWIATVLFWCLAFASKEDSIALPAYFLALELTVLRFGAARPELARILRNAWLLLVIGSIAFYVLLVIPHFWVWDSYPGRDYSTFERLLTQPRMLVMYLGQILLPLPEHLPFYYDWVVPSRTLLQPWTTLPAIALVAALLMSGWRLRLRHPLLSLGIFLFFAGHFISSNVIGLELAFEHRNHFPLIGAVLALGYLAFAAMRRMRLCSAISFGVTAALVLALSSATIMRAVIWGEPMQLATKGTEFAPRSARAWNSLCITNYHLSGKQPDSPYLDRAIEACEKGAAMPYATSTLTNLVVFKTIRGDVTQADWNRLLDRLRHAIMGGENSRSVWVLLTNVQDGVALDEDGVLEAIHIVTRRSQLTPVEHAALGYFILDQTSQPNEAYLHFALAIENSHPDSMFPGELLADLQAKGRARWAEKLKQLKPLQENGDGAVAGNPSNR